MPLYPNVKNLSSKYSSILQNEFIYSGHFGALGAPAIIISVSIILKINLDLPILFISYLVPLIVYSYDYYKDLYKDIKTNEERSVYWQGQAKRYPIVLGVYIALLISLIISFSNQNLLIFILAIFFCGFLYTILFKGLTKRIPGFKNIYTSLIWALAGSFFLLFHYSLKLDISFIILFILIFLRFIINVTFFDIKDLESDREEGLKTLPVTLGKEHTLKFLQIFNIFSFIPLFVGIYMKEIPLFAFSLILFYFYSFYYMKKAETVTSEELRFISYTMVDGEFMLWPILLLIAGALYYSL